MADIEAMPHAVPPGEQTNLFVRSSGQEKWQRMAPVSGRMVALASRGSQAVGLLKDGGWMVLPEDGGRPFSGRPLPAGAKMVALAGDRNDLWAVGRVSGGLAALATQPTSQASTQPATEPAFTSRSGEASATQPAAPALVLFFLGHLDWEARGQLPADLSADAEVSLLVLNNAPIIATRDGDRTIQLRSLGKSGGWTPAGTITAPSSISIFKLLGPAGTVPLLWVAPVEGSDQLYFLGQNPPRQIALATPRNTKPQDRAVAVATGQIRYLTVQSEKLYEQDYDPGTGKAAKGQFPVTLPEVTQDSPLTVLRSPVVTVALVFAILASLRQRVQMRRHGGGSYRAFAGAMGPSRGGRRDRRHPHLSHARPDRGRQ